MDWRSEVRVPRTDPTVMTRSNRLENAPPPEKEKNRLPGWATGVLAAESIALAIALVAPVTPSKTGSTWSPANLFSASPTYLEKVGASFVLVNVLLFLLGLAAWFLSRREPD